MEVIIVADADAVGDVAARQIMATLRRRDTPTFGVATGSSPLPVYRALIGAYQHGVVSFTRTHMFLLDEYLGLPPDHPESYLNVIRTALAGHVDLPAGNLHGPDAAHPDVEHACAEYERVIAELGGIDVQLIGIGSDGHIGFNEPTSSLSSRTRIKTLTAQTRHDNARFFASPDEVPVHVITQGIGSILDAGHLVLVASGESKAASIARAVEGPLAAMFPASAIQLHRHATVVIDEAAAGQLTLADYYRDVYANKPAWQQ